MSNKMLTSDGLAEVWSRIKSCFVKKPSGQVGSGTEPVYVNSDGEITASSSSAGNFRQPCYMKAGRIMAIEGTFGSETKPIYLNSGIIIPSNATVGSSTKPVYMNSGTFTASNATVGSSTKPVYMNSGTFTASDATVGSSSTPAYLSSGTITACTGVAPKVSPALTGTPTAPTASVGTNTTQIATTAFVQTAIDNAADGSRHICQGTSTLSSFSISSGTKTQIKLNTIDGWNYDGYFRLLNNGIQVVKSGCYLISGSTYNSTSSAQTGCYIHKAENSGSYSSASGVHETWVQGGGGSVTLAPRYMYFQDGCVLYLVTRAGDSCTTYPTLAYLLLEYLGYS